MSAADSTYITAVHIVYFVTKVGFISLYVCRYVLMPYMANALLSETAFVAGIRRTDWTTIPVIQMKLEIEAND